MRLNLCLVLVVALLPLAVFSDEFSGYFNPYLEAASAEVDSRGIVWWVHNNTSNLVMFDASQRDLQVYRLPRRYWQPSLAIDTSDAVWVYGGDACRFSQSGVHIFDLPNGPGSALAAAPDGSVWAAKLIVFEQRPVLIRFEGDSWEEVSPPGLSSTVGGLCFAPDGTGWFRTRYALFRLRDGEWTKFDYEFPTPSWEMAVVPWGDLWVCGGVGVLVFKEGQFVRQYTKDDGLVGTSPERIAVDTQNRVWVGDRYSGVSMFDGHSWSTFTTLNSALPDNSILDIAASPDGSVYFTTRSGIARFNNGIWNCFSATEEAPLSNDVYSVAVDQRCRLFYGTRYGQIGYYDGVRWRALDNPPGSLTTIWDIDFAPDGSIWIGTSNYLKRWSGTMRSYLRAGPDGIGLDNSYAVYVDTSGTVWVLASTGVARYDGASWRSWSCWWKASRGGITGDPEGRIWVGTEEGIAVFHDDKVDDWLPQYKDEGSLAITCDQDGCIWVGFRISRGGVAQLRDKEEVARYTTDDGLPSNWINCIACDSANRIWVGTNDGLAFFDGTEWTSWDIDSGLPVNEIRDIAIAPNGDVWFATPAGLLCHESGVSPPGPSITISTDRPLYHAGDTMTVTISYENPGPDVDIDIQIACMLPDGSLYYYPGGDVPVPFSSGMLPSGTKVPMVIVLSYEFPEGFPTGDYTWLAVICEQGTFNFLSDISSASFTVQ